jgi:hypothetical protein
MAFQVGPTNDEQVNRIVREVMNGSTEYVVTYVTKRPYTHVIISKVFTFEKALDNPEVDLYKVGLGFAKVDFPDRWNPVQGRRLALQRAVKDFLYGDSKFLKGSKQDRYRSFIQGKGDKPC